MGDNSNLHIPDLSQAKTTKELARAYLLVHRARAALAEDRVKRGEEPTFDHRSWYAQMASLDETLNHTLPPRIIAAVLKDHYYDED